MKFTSKTMVNLETKEILEKLQVFEKGHYIYTSGKHGDTYVRKDRIYSDLPKSDKIAQMMANCFSGSEYNIEVVIGPAIGGALLARDVARHLFLKTNRRIIPIFAEKENDIFAIKRDYDKIINGKRILIVEDILTTGSSVKGVVRAVQKAGGKIIAVCTICNRGNVKEEDIGDGSFFLHSLFEIHLPSFTPDECPLCKRGIPFNTNVGKAKKASIEQNPNNGEKLINGILDSAERIVNANIELAKNGFQD